MDLKKRIDVCFATREFAPTFSGAALRISSYAPGMRDRGVFMHVFTGTPVNEQEGNQDLSYGAFLEAEDYNGTPVQRVHLPQGSICKRNRTFAPALIRYCREAPAPDVLHSISTSFCWLPWFAQFKRLRIPILHTSTIVGDLSNNPVRRCLQRIHRRLPYHIVDCVIVSSGVMKASLRDLGVSKRIEIIPNGVDLNRFQPTRSWDDKVRERARMGFSQEDEIILFVGGLIERKGVDILLQAWNEISRFRPRAKLVLVGPGENDMTLGKNETGVEIAQMVSVSEADRVIQTGKIDNVEDYYRIADVLAFPSRREGFGNVILEAYASRLPVILAPFVGLSSELGVSGRHYLLSKRTPGSFAKAIITLLDDRQQQEYLSENSIRLVEDTMNIEDSITAYCELYRDLCEISARRR